MFPYTIGANKTITLQVQAKTHSVRSDDPNYQAVLDAIKEERWEDIPDLVDRAKSVAHASKDMFRVVDGQVLCKDLRGQEFAVPTRLSEEVIRYQSLGLDFTRLLKFAQRLMENPSYRAVNQLFDWISRAGLTITEDGKFIAYRGVMRVTPENRVDVKESAREAEYVDWYTKSMDNSIGKEVSMPRNQVDEDPFSSCSRGLHVASYNYAHAGYASGKEDGVVLFVEVCPSDVVAVPNGETDKMRVCRFMPLGISDGPVNSPIWDEPEPSTARSSSLLDTSEDVEYGVRNRLSHEDDDEEDEEDYEDDDEFDDDAVDSYDRYRGW